MKLKHLIKFGILFFIISLLNLGCQKDESLEPNEQVQEQNPFTINHINSNQISNNTKLALSLERLNAAKTKSNTNTENRTAHSEEHNFYIDTERAVYIESQDGSYHSYTFLVQRNDEQTGLENLLLSLQEDGSYTAKLIKYDFEFYGTDGFLEALSNNHNNVHITPIDADGLTASLFARTTTSGVCFFITETSCSYGNHSGGYYANGNQCPGHHSHTRMECLGGGGQSGNSGTRDGSATTGSGETDSTTGGSGSTNGETLGGNNNNDFTLPLTLSMAEQLSSFIDLTLEQEIWANKPQNEDSVKLMIDLLLSNNENAELVEETIENLMSYTSSNYPGMSDGLPFEWWNDENLVENVFQDPYETWKKLSKKEKKLIKIYPAEALEINENKTIAFQKTSQYFGNTPQNLNGKPDAFRHAFFQAINTQDVNQYKTKMFADAHESEVPDRWIKEEQMDLFNNDKGINLIVSRNLYETDINTIASMVNDLVSNGDLVYLKPINYSDPNFWDNPSTSESSDGNHGITFSTTLTPTDE